MLASAVAGVKSPGTAPLAAWFALSDAVLKAFADRHADIEPGPSPVRCWAHHFDIATYVSLEAGDFETARGIGVGLSPGDESYGEPYFYVNPWPHPDPADLPDPPGLGHWHTQGFVGAILTGSELIAAHDIKSAAAEFIAEARRLVRECDEGRAPSACFLELKTALARFDARKPAAQGRPTP